MLSERSYTTIISPVISEKSAIQKTNSNTYVFKVAKDAGKKEITSSIEDIFGQKCLQWMKLFLFCLHL